MILNSLIKDAKCLMVLSIMSLAACKRGTEVGNGNRPEEPAAAKTEEKASNAPESASGNQDDVNDELSDGSGMDQTWFQWLLAPCASPFREAGQQIIESDSERIEVVLSGNTRLVERLNINQSYEVTPVNANNLTDYQVTIAPTVDSNRYQCQRVMVDSSTGDRKYRIIYDNQSSLVSWEYDSNLSIIVSITVDFGEGESLILQGRRE